MKQILQTMVRDDSDQDGFSFSMNCAECGKIWKSLPVRFTKAGVEPKNESKQMIYQTIYKREQQQARDKAVMEAAHHFNQCPMCGRVVCDDCFLICEDLDMCRSCSEKHQESGEPSSFAGWVKD